MVADVLVERHLLRPMPPAPPALAVPRLIDDDPVDPGPQGGLPAERVNRAEDPEKHLLGEVEGLVVVTKEVQRQLIDHPLVLVHELGAGLFVARGTALNQGGFPPPDLSPGDGSNRLHRQSLCHLSTPPLGNHGCFWRLEPGRPREFRLPPFGSTEL